VGDDEEDGLWVRENEKIKKKKKLMFQREEEEKRKRRGREMGKKMGG
jgi:hypothetical protein